MSYNKDTLRTVSPVESQITLDKHCVIPLRQCKHILKLPTAWHVEHYHDFWLSFQNILERDIPEDVTSWPLQNPAHYTQWLTVNAAHAIQLSSYKAPSLRPSAYYAALFIGASFAATEMTYNAYLRSLQITLFDVSDHNLTFFLFQNGHDTPMTPQLHLSLHCSWFHQNFVIKFLRVWMKDGLTNLLISLWTCTG